MLLGFREFQMSLIDTKISECKNWDEFRHLASRQKNEKDQEVILDDRQTGDISDRTYDTYFAKIRRIIDSNKRYPMIARQRQQEGSPKVTFTILKNGNIKDFTIRSSGHRLLDREARRMIMISVPFPKIPESFKQTSIKLTIPINFSLDRRLPSR